MTRRIVLWMLSLLIMGMGTSRLRAEEAESFPPGSGAVYLMTNQPANAILVFNRSAAGTLTRVGAFPTGGAGGQSASGNPLDPLASQSSLLLSCDGHLLFAVNAGSNEISSFRVDPNGLVLLDKVPSGGQTPVSLTIYRDILYVLNAGGAANITGFTVNAAGQLSPLPGSTRLLPGGAAAAPAQVAFSPDGDLLVVTEKMTNMIDVYKVNDAGIATALIAHPSIGMTPFGFSFARPEVLIDSEAFGGGPLQAAASSYNLSESGNLTVLTGSLPDHQTAACWVVVSHRGKYAYTTNTGSSVITGLAVSPTGQISLLNANGVTAATGAGTNPIDMAVTGSLLYVHLSGPNGRSILGYRIGPTGALTQVTKVGDLPMGAQGIAAQ